MQTDPVAIQPDGAFALTIVPLDGSSDIDANLPIGTIFAIYPAADQAVSRFLRLACDLLAGDTSSISLVAVWLSALVAGRSFTR